MEINVFFQLFVLVMSVVIHEISHGFMALFFGDKTAEYEGRLTLNPIKHLDIFGSIILPLFLFITNAGFMIGWAKPVPYNPYNLKHRKIAEPLVAIAGPISNIFIALIFGSIVRYLISSDQINSPLVLIFSFVTLVNISLAIFNLVPIPPLDGSKILFSILPIKNRFVFSAFAHKYGLFILIIIVAFLPNFIAPIVTYLFTLTTGIR